MIKRGNNHGFTVIELLIATSVFSVLLLIIAFSVIQVGRIYTKGIISSKTQESARSITDMVGQSIQFSGGTISELYIGTQLSGYCIGGQRYSFALNRQVDENTGARATAVDTPTGDCVASGAQNLISSPSISGQELLNPKMRLSAFSITPVSASLYSVKVRVVYGDDDLLRDSDGNSTLDSCASAAGNQFCAVSELNTTVEKRLQ
jgi:prepilin-type N-terminal cleavage/methylation domain-containing protein